MSRATAPPLPIDGALPRVVEALRAGPSVVVRAPPGAGKTTRVPPALLEAGIAGANRIVMLEPRRLAARAAALRMATERGGEVGGEVGFQVRFERRAGAATRILVVTEGILVRQLQADPFLEGVGILVFDEFHERRLDTDLALAMARKVQREVRPDLKLVAMSATLETGPVAAFLGGCPVVASDAARFPVDLEYLDPSHRLAADAHDLSPGAIAARAARGVLRELERAGGDVLAFLPGVGEIRRTAEILEGSSAGVDLLQLYGDLGPAEQDAALLPGPRRRVVLATNVAETSVTVEGVTSVVDTGVARVLRFDPASGLDRLEIARIGRASADQRAGRAGRLGPGRCLRLWTEHDHRGRPEHETPEIARVDLAGPVLQLLAWGEPDPAAFAWFEPPEPARLAHARELLELLGAADRRGITALGRRLAELPVHPRLGRLLVEGERQGIPGRAALAASLLAERSPFRRRREGREGSARASRSDLEDRVDAMEAFAAGRRTAGSLGDVDPQAARFVLRAAAQLERFLGRSRATPPAAADAGEGLLRAGLAAYPDRLARRRADDPARAVMAGGQGLRMSPECAVTGEELFVALDVDGGRAGSRPGERAAAEAWVRAASAVERSWLDPERLATNDEVEFDPDRERVVARRRTLYLDLLLDEREVPVAGPLVAAAEEALAAAAAVRLERALAVGEEPVASWLARVRSLAGWRPELGLPTFPTGDLAALLPELARGRRSFAELRRVDLVGLLRGQLAWEQASALEREAPERVTVPSGSRLLLAYEPGRPPVLAVRIQELYGLAETPRVAGGRVPVLLHLLAPSGRPQQVTDDLAGFWERTYPAVRKELAGRYPKHSWPADPRRAEPERRPRRR